MQIDVSTQHIASDAYSHRVIRSSFHAISCSVLDRYRIGIDRQFLCPGTIRLARSIALSLSVCLLLTYGCHYLS